MSAMGKSRTTGWTRAEYERPVSFRQRRSWIPARKSRASRIIGERDVRSIAASTSASTDPSVPSTIWMTIGSIATFFMPCPTSGRSAREGQVAEAIGREALAGIDNGGCPILPDDRRAVQGVAGRQKRALVHGALDGRLREEHRPIAGERAAGPPVARGELAQPGPCDRPDAGDAEVHPLHRLAAGRCAAGGLPIAIAISLLVGFVESLSGHRCAPLVDRTRWQLHRNLPGLTEISQIGAALDANLVLGEALRSERRPGQRLEPREVAVHHRVIETIVALHERLYVVVLEVDREQPEGRDVPG